LVSPENSSVRVERSNTGATLASAANSPGVAESTYKLFKRQILNIEDTTRQDKIQAVLRCARPEDIAEANHRYEQIQPYLSLDAPSTPSYGSEKPKAQAKQVSLK